MRYQAGYLFKKHGSWIGQYRSGNGARNRKKITLALGRVDQMSEAEARGRLRIIIQKTEQETRALHSIGNQVLEIDQPENAKVQAHKSGAISEFLVCADLMSKGWDVYRAADPACACDLVCVKGQQVVRIEVKSGRTMVDLRKKSNKFYILATVSANQIKYYAYHQLGDLNKIIVVDQKLAKFATLLPTDFEKSQLAGGSKW